MQRNSLVSDAPCEALITQALRAVEAQYQELYENVTDIVFTLNSRGDFTSINSAGERASGYSREEALGMNFADIVVDGCAQSARTVIGWQQQEGSLLREIEIIAKDGHPLTLRPRVSTILDHGKPAGVQVIARARTRLTDLDEESRQSEKMEVMGRLGAGMAHDFNNVLTAIMGYGYLVQEKLEAGSSTHREVGEMLRAAQRAATLATQMLGFSRKEKPEGKVIDLNEAVTGVEQMLRRVITEDIEIVTTLEPGLEPIQADQSAIELAILNLVLNARDAMPRGGTLTLETSTVSLETHAAASVLGLDIGKYARVRIRDTGCGMTPQTLSRAFDQFFTTKERGRGTGLGLPSALAAVKQSNGHITVRSEPQIGTTFEIYLPTARQPAEDSIAGGPCTQLEAGCKTVLIVDDEEMIRNVIRTYLRRSGYLVLEAASGLEATRIAQQHIGPIDLLLTDVVMPQMGGPQSAELLLAAHPEMKVLYMSGHSRDTLGGYGIGESDSTLLKKPFTPDSLERKVRELLASSIAPLHHAARRS